MSAKDNFAQAMKELLNGPDGEVRDDEFEDKKPVPTSFSSFSQPEAKPPRPAAPPPRRETPPETPRAAAPAPAANTESRYVPPSAPAPAPAPAPVAAAEPRPVAAPAPTPPPAPQYNYAREPEPSAPAPAPAPTYAPPPPPATPLPDPTSVETTILANGTTVIGDVIASGGLRIGGSVRGNLKVAGRLELSGKVIGDIEAAEADIVSSLIRGNITISGPLSMDGNTTVVGDVSAQSAESDGKVKGNMTVAERSHFLPGAILVGNLMSGTVIIDEGAMLKGDVSITSAPTENVTVEEPDFDIDF